MKKEITGYLTGLINSYTRTIERLKRNGAPIAVTNPFNSFKEELTDLLEFVIDIPMESVTDTYIEINRLRDILAKKEVRSEDLALEIIMLRQNVAELEESCENMCEVERNLHKKIEEAEKEKNEFWECNKQLNQLYKEKRSKNEILQTKNEKLKYDNKKLHKKIELLRKKSNGPIRKNV